VDSGTCSSAAVVGISSRITQRCQLGGFHAYV
jgi:hypothetical protein